MQHNFILVGGHTTDKSNKFVRELCNLKVKQQMPEVGDPNYIRFDSKLYEIGDARNIGFIGYGIHQYIPFSAIVFWFDEGIARPSCLNKLEIPVVELDEGELNMGAEYNLCIYLAKKIPQQIYKFVLFKCAISYDNDSSPSGLVPDIVNTIANIYMDENATKLSQNQLTLFTPVKKENVNEKNKKKKNCIIM